MVQCQGMDQLPKIIVIVGPTASGKTGLGIALAKKFNGEVVSADSRQIYKKMDIGTALPKGEWKWRGLSRVYMVEGIPHFMMAVTDPGKELTLADYKERATGYINDMLKRGKLPIVVGGTGLYVWAIVDNLSIPKIAPNKKLRKSLEAKPLSELRTLLEKLDPATFAHIDIKNPRRVLRALEVVILTGESFVAQQRKMPPLYQALQIGIRWEPDVLAQRIAERVTNQFAEGFVDETKALVKQKYGWHLPSMTSIGYRHLHAYLDGTCTIQEAEAAIEAETRQYAKRQMTWFKRDERIHWIHGDDVEAAQKIIAQFMDAPTLETKK